MDGAGRDEAGGRGLAARPDREKGAENEDAEGERERQEENGQDGERDGEPEHDRSRSRCYFRRTPRRRQFD